MDNTEIVEKFHAEYQVYHGFTDAWVQGQTKAIEQFLELSGKNYADVQAGDLRAYLGQLQAEGFHVNTVRKKGNMVRPFLGWLFDEGALDGNTMFAIKRVGNPKGASGVGKPRPYSRKQLREFWVALDEAWPRDDDKRAAMFRDRVLEKRSRFVRIEKHAMRLQLNLIVRLALDCGLRAGEIFNASLDDLHYDNDYVLVRHAKREAGGAMKTREVPFTEAARQAAYEWIEFRATLRLRHRSPWLSLATTGAKKKAWRRPMTQDRFAEILGKTILPHGQWKLHRLRHTAATEHLRAGMEIQVVSRFLGHATIAQTLVYAELDRTDIHAAMEKNSEAFERAVGYREPSTPVESST